MTVGSLEQIDIRLDADEALVLFEWLASDRPALAKQTDAATPSPELVALQSVEAMLERALPQPFRDDYVELVRIARDRITARFK